MVVTSDVKKAGRVVVPKGAVITGRIMRLDTTTVRSANYLSVGLQFYAIDFNGRHGRFNGELAAAGIGPNYSVRAGGQGNGDFQFLIVKADHLSAETRIVLRTQ
jgi:hypothetical protein